MKKTNLKYITLLLLGLIGNGISYGESYDCSQVVQKIVAEADANDPEGKKLHLSTDNMTRLTQQCQKALTENNTCSQMAENIVFTAKSNRSSTVLLSYSVDMSKFAQICKKQILSQDPSLTVNMDPVEGIRMIVAYYH